MNRGYQTYRSANIDTADQGKLILIAYDVAIKHCKLAEENFHDFKQVETRTKHLFKVQDALNELMGALNLEVGEIAQNLYRLYEYMRHTIVESNINNDVSKVQEVQKHLEALRDAWKSAVTTLKKESAPAASGPAREKDAPAEQSFSVSG